MHPLFDEMVEIQRRKDEFASIQRERLERRILQQNGGAYHRHVLANFGARLVKWGTWLQSHYDSLSAQTAATYSANEKASPCS